MCVQLYCWQINDQAQSKTLNGLNLYLFAVRNECFTNDDNDIEVDICNNTPKQWNLKLQPFCGL